MSTSPNASVKKVPARTSSVELLGANPNRVGAIIVNNTTSTLYVKYGTGASQDSFTSIVRSGGEYTTDFGYPGAIEGVWASVPSMTPGFAAVTELVGDALNHDSGKA